MNQDRLKELLCYSPMTGDFTWLNSGKGRRKNLSAGSDHNGGYYRLNIDGRFYLSHRLAVLYMTGRFPADEVDHINGVRDDNRWINLREVTRGENQKNVCIPSTNKSGIIGVRWYKKYKKWTAYIKVSGKMIYLGYFHVLLDACSARKSAENKHGFHSNHGRKA